VPTGIIVPKVPATWGFFYPWGDCAGQSPFFLPRSLALEFLTSTYELETCPDDPNRRAEVLEEPFQFEKPRWRPRGFATGSARAKGTTRDLRGARRRRWRRADASGDRCGLGYFAN
jgi:hypothetical protein